MYIDFSKAYDMVLRLKLVQILKNLGCGVVMLGVIAATYWSTQSILGTALLTTTIGVKQGFPSSCILFVLYLNENVKMLKQRCPPDGYLKWLHCLLLMDHTILLLTKRETCIAKFDIMFQYCRKHGTIINAEKSKFMVINGNDQIDCRL